jgi:hypothetical protein
MGGRVLKTQSAAVMSNLADTAPDRGCTVVSILTGPGDGNEDATKGKWKAREQPG